MSAVIEEARRFYTRGQYEKAIEYLRSQDVPEGEEDSWAYYIGLCYTRVGNYDDALLYLEQVVTGASGEARTVQCRLLLAYIYSVTGRYRLAEYELREIVEIGQADDRTYAGLGYVAYRQGLLTDAISHYEKALELSPNNPTSLNALGYILVEVGRDVKRAMGLIRKALELQPDNAAYLDSIGWALHRTGFSERGRLYLEKALRLAPDATEIRGHLTSIEGRGE